jgi:hypothetical protein
LSSQGGNIVFYYDKSLETSESPTNITLAAWKSYRLKRKAVSTLSAETQSLLQGVGAVSWHRFMLLEALHGHFDLTNWERELAKLPFIALIDSKSVFDAVRKCSNPASQVEDKRTAIDIAVIKQDLSLSHGSVRWIDTRAMLADPLTKGMSTDFLRHVMTTGQWTVLEEGNALQRKLAERQANEDKKKKKADVKNPLDYKSAHECSLLFPVNFS